MLALFVVVGCSNPTDGNEKDKPPVIKEEITGMVAQISGVVYNTKTIQPIDGVQVELIGAEVPTVFTDSAGVYAFKNVKPGTYTVAFAKTGYQFRTKNVYIDPNEYWKDDPYMEKDLLNKQLADMNAWRAYQLALVQAQSQQQPLPPDLTGLNNLTTLDYDWSYSPDGVWVNGAKDGGDIAITINKEDKGSNYEPGEYKFEITEVKKDSYKYSKAYSLYVTGMAPLSGAVKGSLRIFETPYSDTKNVTLDGYKDIPEGVEVWLVDQDEVNVGWGLKEGTGSTGAQPGYETDNTNTPVPVGAKGYYGPAKTGQGGTLFVDNLPVGVKLRLYISSFITVEGFYFKPSGSGDTATGATAPDNITNLYEINYDGNKFDKVKPFPVQALDSGGELNAAYDIGLYYLFTEGEFAYTIGKELGNSGIPIKADGKLELTFSQAINPAGFKAYLTFSNAPVGAVTETSGNALYVGTTVTQLSLLPTWSEGDTKVTLEPAETIAGFFSQHFPYSKNPTYPVGKLVFEGYAHSGAKLYAAIASEITSNEGDNAKIKGFPVYTEVGLQIKSIDLAPKGYERGNSRAVQINTKAIKITFNKPVSSAAQFAWRSSGETVTVKPAEFIPPTDADPNSFIVYTNLLSTTGNATGDSLVYTVYAKDDPKDRADGQTIPESYELTRFEQYLTLVSTNIYAARDGSAITAVGAKFPVDGDITFTFNKDIPANATIRAALYEGTAIPTTGTGEAIWDKTPTSIELIASKSTTTLTLKHPDQDLKADTNYLLALDINNTADNEALFNWETFRYYGALGSRTILQVVNRIPQLGVGTNAAIAFRTAKDEFLIRETNLYRLVNNKASATDEFFPVDENITLTFNKNLPANAKIEAVLVEDTGTTESDVRDTIFNKKVDPQDPNTVIVDTTITDPAGGKILTIKLPTRQVKEDGNDVNKTIPLKYATTYKLAIRITRGDDTLFSGRRTPTVGELGSNDYIFPNNFILYSAYDSNNTDSIYTIRFTTSSDKLKLLRTNIYDAKKVYTLPVFASYADFPITGPITDGKRVIRLTFNQDIPEDALVGIYLVREDTKTPVEAPEEIPDAVDSLGNSAKYLEYLAKTLVTYDKDGSIVGDGTKKPDGTDRKNVLEITVPNLIHHSLYYLAVEINDKNGRELFGQSELTKKTLPGTTPPYMDFIDTNYSGEYEALNGYRSIIFRTVDKTIRLKSTNIYDNRKIFNGPVTADNANFPYKEGSNRIELVFDTSLTSLNLTKDNVKFRLVKSDSLTKDEFWQYDPNPLATVAIDTADPKKLVITPKKDLGNKADYSLALEIADKRYQDNVYFGEAELVDASTYLSGKIDIKTTSYLSEEKNKFGDTIYVTRQFPRIKFRTEDRGINLLTTNIYDERKDYPTSAVASGTAKFPVVNTDGKLKPIELSFTDTIPTNAKIEVLFANRKDVNFIRESEDPTGSSINSFYTTAIGAGTSKLTITTPLYQDKDGQNQYDYGQEYYLAVCIRTVDSDIIFDSTEENLPGYTLSQIDRVKGWEGIGNNGIGPNSWLIAFTTADKHYTEVRPSSREGKEVTETSSVFSLGAYAVSNDPLQNIPAKNALTANNATHKFEVTLDDKHEHEYFIQFTDKTDHSDVLKLGEGIKAGTKLQLYKDSGAKYKGTDDTEAQPVDYLLAETDPAILAANKAPFELEVTRIVGSTILGVKIVKAANYATATREITLKDGANSTASGAHENGMIKGQKYKIGTPGAVNWTAIGATANTAGTEFTYNGEAVTGAGATPATGTPPKPGPAATVTSLYADTGWNDLYADDGTVGILVSEFNNGDKDVNKLTTINTESKTFVLHSIKLQVKK